ncbi:AfsR/SARP family transcriptional regulator [Actinophytocola sp.]|uniref:AfsR/SARP family transcriptional regulator n=1 Tax=Actinophytocola sp. TaxID=1872138 RepID=UPI002D7F61E6|nr:BTAD domain-containing putative transcriptional regulator [Actinophytocola sp.]HET9142973.1 BTAD domain-containing putative transcriptional regulator [Actinophytocola sp.]
MEFRLLGAVEASVNGQPIDLGPGRQRCVLVALLADVNHVVPVEELLERVWGDRRPHRALGTLYSYLSRLRKVLTVDGGVDIAHRSGGYVLDAEPALVDLHRFRQLVAHARSAGDEAAAAALEESLALWRGEPFATLDNPWINQFRAVLEAERRSALLDRNDLELRRGRHGDLLAELSILAGEHPLDERLAGQLMLALYRAGRQAEAVRIYQSTRGALVEELGLEPGPELSSLHQRILAADPNLAGPASAWGRAPVGPDLVPRQLPADVAHFTGRDRYLAQLHELLDDTRPPTVAITAIDGTAGVGKTALAIHFGHQIAGRFPDGQLYIDLGGHAPGSPMTAVDALGWMLRSLGVLPERIPADEQERAALYRSLLADRRMLVVLDNARSAAHVRSLLPANPRCAVIVTSRTSLASLDGAHHLHLDVLTEDEALVLLARLTGQGQTSREPEAAGTLVLLCARLPLAVRIAGARLAARPGWTIAALVDRLADEQRRLDELEVDDRAIRASFAVTHHALKAGTDPVDRQAAELFRLLGMLHWTEMSVPVAAALLDAPAVQAHTALERLLDAHLLDSTGPGRYVIHDLLRLYAREQANTDTGPDREAALHRALDCFLAAAEEASLLVTSDPRWVRAARSLAGQSGFALSTPTQIADWVDREHANLLAAARQAAETPGTDAMAVRLVAALTRPFDVRGLWNDMTVLLEGAIDIAHRIGDRTGEALVREHLGFGYLWGGRADDTIACVDEALAIYRAIGDGYGEAACLRYLGYAYMELDRLDDAITCHERALSLCRELDYHYGEAGALNALGLGRQRQDRFDEAIACHQQALEINRTVGNRVSECSALDNLGWACLRSGRYDRAAEYFQRAMSVALDIGFRYTQAETLWGLGHVQHALGGLDEARTYWLHAITILRDIGLLTDQEAETLRRQPVPDTPEIIRRNI